MGAYLESPPGTKFGTEGDDYLQGTDTGQQLWGYGGNDWLRAHGGNDYLSGGDGNDLLDGGAGSDNIDGGLHNDTVTYFYSAHAVNVNLAFGTGKTLGAGPIENDTLTSIENVEGSFYDDYIQGSELANRLNGMAGHDVIQGWGGDDFLLGHFGNDFLVGGEGRDTVSGGFDTDTLQGNAGIDTADYTYSYQGMFVSLAQGSSHTMDPSYYTDNDSLSTIENVTGTYYGDVLIGDGGANVLKGIGGDDTLQGGGGQDFINGGDGIDWLDFTASTTAVNANLDTGKGTLGESFGDTYYGIEHINGSNNAQGDQLTGNAYSNIILGNQGNDGLRGLGGNDNIQGGAGVDYLDGGDGADRLRGGAGADFIYGGLGSDTVDMNPDFGGIGPEGPGVTVDLQANTASGLDNDGEAIFEVENVIGTSFDDIIAGNGVSNTICGGGNQDNLRGQGGNDYLYGQNGNDMMLGDDGNDFFNGGGGADFMVGGLGRDQFVFYTQNELGNTGTTRDIIRDFVKGEDIMDLGHVDANTVALGNQSFQFIDDDAFTGVAGQLRQAFLANSTIVTGDVNGDAVADFQLQLVGLMNLSALDFVL